MSDCEKVSVCCGAAEHPDVENFCAQCRDGTGFECSVHEVAWADGECPYVVAERLIAPDARSQAKADRFYGEYGVPQ